jgi:hypothetical protein
MVGQTILSGLFARVELIESNRQVEQMTEAAPHKTMTEGEAGLVMAFSALALQALVGGAKAEETAFETGTQFAGNPMTYAVNGKRYIALTLGGRPGRDEGSFPEAKAVPQNVMLVVFGL